MGACVAVIALAFAGSAAKLKKMHDARYCEVLELKGAPPSAQVVVWNTIGLSGCPADGFASLDPAAIAAEHGDTLVLINGPRYFLMDSVTATPGVSQVFGTLEMRQVATIAIHSAAELAQTPYTERTMRWTMRR